jgi:DNA adenine methylase
MAKPLLKWVGGKTKLVSTIMPLFPKEIKTYYEPFVGGGSMLLAVLQAVRENKISIGTIYASDVNIDLINMYIQIQRHPHDVLLHANRLQTEFRSCELDNGNKKPMTLEDAMTSKESYYYWIRTQYNSLKNQERLTTLGAAYFIFLNKTCFRGLYRVGPNGFNVPYGNYPKVDILDEDNLRLFHEYIKNVVFQTHSYELIVTELTCNDMVYMDPPYVPESATSFVNYTENGFTLDDHQKLFQMCRTLPSKWIMSNSNTPFVLESFTEDEYAIQTVNCKRAIHSRNPGHVTLEVIISHV